MSNKKTKTIEIRRREVRRRRFAAGLREMTSHWAKALITLAYLLVVALAWMNRAAVLVPLFGGSSLVYHSVSLALLLVAFILLAEIIIVLGTPRRAAKVQEALVAAGFVNSTRTPPLLLSAHKALDKGVIYEFDHDNIPLSRWERDKEKIGAALRVHVVSVKLTPDGKKILVHGVPLCSAFPETIYWKEKYLSPEDFTLALGLGVTGKIETVNLADTPHILLGGGTGSGKSILMEALLMQGLKKGAAVILADFKCGVDYAPVWHKRCKMVFDPQALLSALEELTAEMEHRRGLFAAAGTPNLSEYNKATGEALPRYIFACDEVAEVLDTTGLDKGERAVFSAIVHHLSVAARQGRAFGIHLVLSTQRPDAAIIPPQIRSNMSLRVCGRADDILSRIILDSPAAAEQIPPDAKGVFVTNMKQTFKGFLFDDSVLAQ